MSDKHAILATINEHNEVCRKILEFVESENRNLVQGLTEALADESQADAKRALLGQLGLLKDRIKADRRQMESEGQTGDDLDQDIAAKVEEGKQLIMKAVALDRENEKILLKSGRLSPGKLPSAESRRPDLVAKTYLG